VVVVVSELVEIDLVHHAAVIRVHVDDVVRVAERSVVRQSEVGQVAQVDDPVPGRVAE
jgi:hypothetical protein